MSKSSKTKIKSLKRFEEETERIENAVNRWRDINKGMREETRKAILRDLKKVRPSNEWLRKHDII